MKNDRKNKALIGVFVLGALAILLTTLLIVGSGGFYKKTTPFVLYFDSSLNGLISGSPVLFRGVKIGQVTSIKVESNMEKFEFRTPVFIEIDNSLAGRSDNGFLGEEDYYFEQLVQKGMSAKLATLSFLTGQLSIELDFYKESSPVTNIKYHAEDGGIMEIPTQPSAFDEILKRFNNLPVEEIAIKLVQALDSVNNVLNSDVSDLATSFTTLTAELSALIVDMQEQITNINPLVASANNVFLSTEKNMNLLGSGISQSLDNLNRSLDSLNLAIKSGTQFIENSKQLIADDSPILIDLSRTLRDLSDSANSIKDFADIMSRNPNALIFGKSANY